MHCSEWAQTEHMLRAQHLLLREVSAQGLCSALLCGARCLGFYLQHMQSRALAFQPAEQPGAYQQESDRADT